HPHGTLGTFEQQHPQLLLQFLHADAEGGLRYMAALGSVAEMLFLGEGHYVTKFGQGHVVYCSLRFFTKHNGLLDRGKQSGRNIWLLQVVGTWAWPWGSACWSRGGRSVACAGILLCCRKASAGSPRI